MTLVAWRDVSFSSMHRLDCPRNDVHLWRVRVSDFMPQLGDLALTLSMEEVVRAERYRFAETRERFTIARALLRWFLGSYLDERPERVELGTGPFGKPRLADQANNPLRFNLAHSDDTALYAFACDREVGVDVEHIRATPSATAIARRFFSDLEQQWLASHPADQLDAAFLALWTCKEAHSKARGTGLSSPTLRLDAALSPPAGPVNLQTAWVHAEPEGAWYIQWFAAAEAYVGALSAQLLPDATPRVVNVLQYSLIPV